MMKKAPFLLSFYFVAFLIQGQAAGESPSTEAFSGTWILESQKRGASDVVNYTAVKEPHQVLFITGTHFIIGRINPETMRLTEVRHAGQFSQGKDEGTFTETVECGNKGIEGQSFQFEMKLVDGKLHKTGEIGAEAVEQVWVPFSKFSRIGDHTPTTFGQQIIDLKRAKDAGALSEEEFQAEKAKLLKSSGK